MGALSLTSEIPATVEAPVVGLATAGTAIAMWESVHRRDQRFGTALIETASPAVVVASGATLAAHLLRRAGTLLDPRGRRAADVETAAVLLAGVLRGTPGERPLGQVVTQVAADPTTATVLLVDVSVQEIMVLVEAAAFLVARCEGVSVLDVLADTRARLALDAAA